MVALVIFDCVLSFVLAGFRYRKGSDYIGTMSQMHATRWLSLRLLEKQGRVDSTTSSIGHIDNIFGHATLLADDPLLGYRLKPNTALIRQERTEDTDEPLPLSVYLTNDQGFAATNKVKFHYEIPKPPSVFRVVMVGGSTVFGVGVQFTKDNLPAQLERRLQQDFPDWTIEVVNAGVIGYRSPQETLFVLGKVGYLQPDLVIVYDGWNDSNTYDAVLANAESGVNTFSVLDSHQGFLESRYSLPKASLYFLGTLVQSTAYFVRGTGIANVGLAVFDRFNQSIKISYATGGAFSQSWIGKVLAPIYARKQEEYTRDHIVNATGEYIFGHYKRNLELMVEAAKGRFKIAVFLQPMLGVDGKVHTNTEDASYMNLTRKRKLELMYFYTKARIAFEQLAKDRSSENALIKDISYGVFGDRVGSVYTDEGHLNASGNQAVAEAIAKEVIKKGFLNTSSPDQEYKKASWAEQCPTPGIKRIALNALGSHKSIGCDICTSDLRWTKVNDPDCAEAIGCASDAEGQVGLVRGIGDSQTCKVCWNRTLVAKSGADCEQHCSNGETKRVVAGELSQSCKICSNNVWVPSPDLEACKAELGSAPEEVVKNDATQGPMKVSISANLTPKPRFDCRVEFSSGLHYELHFLLQKQLDSTAWVGLNLVPTEASDRHSAYFEPDMVEQSHYRCEVRAKSTDGSESVAVSESIVKIPDLVGYWSMDEAAPWTEIDGPKDYSGNHQDLKVVGRIQQLQGRSSKSARIAGGAYFVTKQDAAYLPTGFQDRTVSVWIKTGIAEQQNPLIFGMLDDNHGTLAKSRNIDGSVNGISLFPGTYWVEGLNVRCEHFPAVSNDGAWHHVVYTYNGKSQSVTSYFDGQASPSCYQVWNTNLARLYLGARLQGSGAQPFDGWIDEVAIFNRELRPAEIKQLYEKPGIMFETTKF